MDIRSDERARRYLDGDGALRAYRLDPDLPRLTRGLSRGDAIDLALMMAPLLILVIMCFWLGD